MSYSLAFSKHAENDIIEAIQWYNTEKENLGFELYNVLVKKFSIIVTTHFTIQFGSITFGQQGFLDSHF